MIRAFAGIQAIGAASQPVFGTTTTAAVKFAVDRYTGTNTPGTTTPAILIAVTSSTGFQVDDRVQVGPKANFTAANRGNLDHGTVASIPDSTHITVQGLLQNHASGDYVVLDEPASFVLVLPVSTAHPLYLGTDETVAANDPSVFDVIAMNSSTTAEPTYWHTSPPNSLGDSYQTSQYWIAGTAADTFVARFHQN